MRVVLTIAGSDSSGGAGIQADLKTFAALGVYGASAITAVTAQSTVGVVESFALSADLVTAQIEAVAGDIEIHATKTGMLADAAIVEAVAAAIKEMDLPVSHQVFEMECSLEVEVRSSLIEAFMTRCEKVEGLEIHLLS